MLTFNELRISPDNKYLIVDVSVDKQDYFKDVTIDSIIVDTQDTYVPDGPSDTPVYTYITEDMYDRTYTIDRQDGCSPVYEDGDDSYCLTYGKDKMKNIRLLINTTDLKVSPCSTMFFVYVTAKGTPSPDTPYGFGKSQVIGTVVNLQPIYKYILRHLKEVSRECSIPREFIDIILKIKALELCVRTGNYPQAIKYWNKFFVGNPYIFPPANCGCYG